MKKLICTMALAALLCGAAGAANGSYTVAAELSPNITVKIDGVERVFYNAQGQEVHPISYAGTTYVPIRSIGELMDKNVNWDGTTNTATISGSRVTPDATGTLDVGAVTQNITLSIEPSYTIVIDGTARTFYNVNGQKVDPALYNGSIYLPIRAIGEIMGKTVSWDGATQTVFISGSTAGGEVTDFDTNTPSGNTGNTGNVGGNTGNIGGNTGNIGNVGGNTGNIGNVGGNTGNVGGNTGNIGTTTGAVTLEQAKQTALNHAGKTASQVTFVKTKSDWEYGRTVYEIEFIYRSGTGYLEYDYEIDSTTGKILSYDYDAEGYVPSTGGTGVTGGTGIGGQTASISADRAKQIALARVPGASTANIYEFKLDYDDGRLEYEGKIIYNTMEYEFEINASTGSIVSWDVESIYD